MPALRRFLLSCAATVGLLLCGGCTTTSMLISAAGVATDTSMSWEIVKHFHDKFTEGDPTPCLKLNTVQRALSGRCGEFQKGSLLAQDVAKSGLQECPLILATQDPKLWPVVPELLNKGAKVESCWQSPLLNLAQANACPDFSRASAEVREAFVWLAEADSRAVQHDVMRMLSCPSARMAGLSRVLDTWEASGDLQSQNIGFSPLGALHPSYLSSPFADKLIASGHTARSALGPFAGRLTSGFEEALRLDDEEALGWWFARVPTLVNKVPSTQGAQPDWAPLARVLQPKFLAQPERQGALLEYLLAQGADPQALMPYNRSQSIVGYARWLQSPHVALLESPPPRATPTRVADAAEPAKTSTAPVALKVASNSSKLASGPGASTGAKPAQVPITPPSARRTTTVAERDLVALPSGQVE